MIWVGDAGDDEMYRGEGLTVCGGWRPSDTSDGDVKVSAAKKLQGDSRPKTDPSVKKTSVDDRPAINPRLKR
jgi:hypothetical protein